MTVNGVEEMYAEAFISYLDSKFTIRLLSFDNTGREIELFYGSKWDAVSFLKNAGYSYILCDNDSMYTQGTECSIYVE